MARRSLRAVRDRTRTLSEHVVANGARSLRAKRRRPLLLVGHPRSGTAYVAALLQHWGLDVGHERVGKHGTSAWYAFCDRTPPYCRHIYWDTYEFDKVIHVTRRPRNAIPSIAFTEGPTERFRLDALGLTISNDRIADAIASLDGWTRHIRSSFDIDYVLQIERDPADIFGELQAIVPVPMHFRPFKKVVNSRKQRYASHDLEAILGKHAGPISALDQLLGYPNTPQ